MKSFAKLFLLLPLAFSMSLAGCKETKKPSSTTSDPTSSEVVPGSSEGEGSSEGGSSSEEVVEGLSPEEAAAEIASCWGGASGEIEDHPGIFGAYGAFSAASYSVEDMKGFVSSIFVPEEFELVSDWAEDSGAEVCYYINAINTVLEIYVYADTLYVDEDGKIVPEGTEGATAVEATCIELYAYTYSE